MSFFNLPKNRCALVITVYINMYIYIKMSDNLYWSPVLNNFILTKDIKEELIPCLNFVLTNDTEDELVPCLK